MSIRDAAASYVTELITHIQLQGVPTVVSHTNLPFIANLLLSLCVCVCVPDTEAVRVLVLDIIVSGVKQGIRSKYEVRTVQNVNFPIMIVAWYSCLLSAVPSTHFFFPPSLFHGTTFLTPPLSLSLYVHMHTHTHTHTHTLKLLSIPPQISMYGFASHIPRSFHHPGNEAMAPLPVLMLDN